MPIYKVNVELETVVEADDIEGAHKEIFDNAEDLMRDEAVIATSILYSMNELKDPLAWKNSIPWGSEDDHNLSWKLGKKGQLHQRILQALEIHNGRCTDNEKDRQHLANALVEALDEQ